MTRLEMLAFVLAFIVALGFPRAMFALVLSIVLGWPLWLMVVLTIGGFIIDVIVVLNKHT